MTAIWQALNQKFFDDDKSKEVKDDPLYPFHNVDKKLFKSNEVECWRNLNYDYDIVQGSAERTTNEVKRLYGQKSDELYGKRPVKRSGQYYLTITYDRYVS